MSKALVVISHSSLPHELTLEIDRDLLTYAQGGRNPAARDKIVLTFKREYSKQYSEIKRYLSWDGLQINETDESAARPQGCGCDCAGCNQGYHCHKEHRDCNM